MKSVSNILLEKEILLESGTNELEVLVFRVADCMFGINVAKVREVLPVPKIVSLPKAHPSVMGVFQLREAVVPCVSLHRHLGIEPDVKQPPSTFILTDFNKHQTAFLVDQVERIHRLSWENVLAVPSMLALAQTPITAVARINQRLVIMLDFEMISDQVTEQFYRTGAVDNPLGIPRGELKVLLVDDSPTVRQAITSTLRASGYTNLQVFENGALAWQWIETRLKETGDASQVGDLLVSDVEMPQVDGFHLTKRIKEHPQLGWMPVMLYSSIVSPDNRKKGEAVGADAQIAKPELAKVVELADKLIGIARRGEGFHNDSAEAAPAPATPPANKTATKPAVAPSAVASEVPSVAPSKSVQANAPVAALVSATALQTSAKTTQVTTSAKSPQASTSAAPKSTASSAIGSPLWVTFCTELADRVNHLMKLGYRAAAGERSEAVLNDLFRTLHTIKSASMVVPVPEISDLTHQMESLLESARQDANHWPVDVLLRYAAWLADASAPSLSAKEVSLILASGDQLQTEICQRL